MSTIIIIIIIMIIIKHHNEVAEWLREQEELSQNLPEQEWKDIEKEEVTSAIKKTNNWKSPGQDKIPNFWLQNLQAFMKI